MGRASYYYDRREPDRASAWLPDPRDSAGGEGAGELLELATRELEAALVPVTARVHTVATGPEGSTLDEAGIAFLAQFQLVNLTESSKPCDGGSAEVTGKGDPQEDVNGTRGRS